MNETKTYEEVARLCSKFCPCKDGGCTCNSTSSKEEVSCKNCSHFTNSYCELNLYDQIVNSHQI